MKRRSKSDLARRLIRRSQSSSWCLGLSVGLLACSGTSDLDTAEPGAGAPDGAVSAESFARAPDAVSRTHGKPLPPAMHALRGEIDTLLLAASLVEERAAALTEPSLRVAGAPVAELVATAAAAGDGLSGMAAGSPADLPLQELASLSRASAQIPVLVKRWKQALRAAGKHRTEQAALFASLDTLKVAARSLGTRVAEAEQASGISPLHGLASAESLAVTTFSGPLFPGAPWYVLTEGHIDAIDVAYEDDELGISIHDESVTPDVERDPATTILLVKSSARVQVPDARFSFLGPVGSDVWILPEGQAEAEAAGVLWAGIASEEVEASVFLDDAIEIQFRDWIGPNGLSLFESPEDELSNPTILVDSEDGLPDTLAMPVGIHRHANWAFESPGLYLVRIQARGRLAELPGNPWVSSANAVLKFVVVP